MCTTSKYAKSSKYVLCGGKLLELSFFLHWKQVEGIQLLKSGQWRHFMTQWMTSSLSITQKLFSSGQRICGKKSYSCQSSPIAVCEEDRCWNTFFVSPVIASTSFLYPVCLCVWLVCILLSCMSLRASSTLAAGRNSLERKIKKYCGYLLYACVSEIWR